MKRPAAVAVALLACLVLAGSAMAQEAPVRVRLDFDGISQEQLDAHSGAIIASIASVAGVPEDYVTRVGAAAGAATPAPAPAAPSDAAAAAAPAAAPATPSLLVDANGASGTGRRLSAAAIVVEYDIRTNSSAGPWASAEVIRRKVLSSAAGFGQASNAGFGRGFYATLDKNGVALQPAMYLDGVRILSGGLPLDAPKSRFGARTTSEPKIFAPEDLSPRAAGEAADGASASPAELRSAAPASGAAGDAGAASAGRRTALPPWAIGVIVAGAILFAALTSAVLWRKCGGSAGSCGRLPQSRSAQQFLTGEAPSGADRA